MRIVQFIILTFDANAKLLNFTEKLKTGSGKNRINMVTWSFPTVCRKRNSKSLYCWQVECTGNTSEKLCDILRSFNYTMTKERNKQ